MNEQEIKVRYRIITKLMNNKFSRPHIDFITQLVNTDSMENLVFAEQLIDTLAM